MCPDCRLAPCVKSMRRRRDRESRTIHIAAMVMASIDSQAAQSRFPAPAAWRRSSIATFNASMNRGAAGELAAALRDGNDPQIAKVAAIIRAVDPDVIAINEFDYGAGLDRAFVGNYLDDAYPFSFISGVHPRRCGPEGRTREWCALRHRRRPERRSGGRGVRTGGGPATARPPAGQRIRDTSERRRRRRGGRTRRRHFTPWRKVQDENPTAENRGFPPSRE